MKPIEYSKIKSGLYSIEEDGRVYSHYAKKYMKTSIDKDGYETITLVNDKGGYSHFGIHRLLMIAFNPVENMEYLQINHIDGNKKNNDISNLEWCTTQENLKHARDTGLNPKIFGGEIHSRAKIKQKDAKDIIEKRLVHGMRIRDIAKLYPQIKYSTVRNITTGQIWKELDDFRQECLRKRSTTMGNQ